MAAYDLTLFPQRSAHVKDLTGQRFGRLTAVAFGGIRNLAAVWICRCDCGVWRAASSNHLLGLNSLSCGCVFRETVAARWQHGLCGTKAYRAWVQMKNRCLNKRNRRFSSYGGRGIKVCERWLRFENFYADMGDPPTRWHSLDRIDNDGNYEPGNCRWATPAEQGNNKRNNVILTLNGESLPLSHWASRLNVRRSAIYQRLLRGASAEAALTKPFRKVNRGVSLPWDYLPKF